MKKEYVSWSRVLSLLFKESVRDIPGNPKQIIGKFITVVLTKVQTNGNKKIRPTVSLLTRLQSTNLSKQKRDTNE